MSEAQQKIEKLASEHLLPQDIKDIKSGKYKGCFLIPFCIRAQLYPILYDHMDCSPPSSWDFPGKNTGVGCHALLQGIFPTQGSNPRLLHWQVSSFTTEPPEKPSFLSTNRQIRNHPQKSQLYHLIFKSWLSGHSNLFCGYPWLSFNFFFLFFPLWLLLYNDGRVE